MKGVLKLIPIALSTLLLLCAAVDRENVLPMYTSSIDLTEDGRVVLANKGTREVVLLAEDGKVAQRWTFEEPATGVAVSGDKLFVTTSHAKGFLSCIDLKDGKMLYSTETAMGACAPVVSHDGERVYVMNRYRGTVSEVNASTGEVLRSVAVQREPCAAVLSPDGRYLYVNNHFPAQRADVDYVAADV